MSGQRGSILVFVTLTVSVLMLVGLTFATATTAEYRSAMHHTHGIQAFYVAEAGLNWARRSLEQGTIVLPTGLAVGQEHIVYRSAAFGGTDTFLGTIGEMRIAAIRRTATEWELLSEGRQQVARRTLAWQMTVTEGTGSSAVLNRHHIATTLSVSSDARLAGNVDMAGPFAPGRMSGSVNGTITYGSTMVFERPTLPAAPTLPWRGDFTSGAFLGSGHYGLFGVAGERVVSINVPDHNDVIIRVQQLEVRNDGQIRITGTGTGRVVFHVDGAAVIRDDSRINDHGNRNPAQFVIYHRGSTQIVVRDNVIFRGSIAAPHANVTLRDDVVIEGNILSGSDTVLLQDDVRLIGVLYAPSAAITIRDDVQVAGTAVGRSLGMQNDSRLTIDPSILARFDPFAQELQLWQGAAGQTISFHRWGAR